MLDTYVVLKKKNHQDLESYYYPDFLYTYTCLENNSLGISHDSASILSEHIISLKAQHHSIPFPRPLKYFQDKITINVMDEWSICYIDSVLIEEKWEIFLPKLGIFSSFVTAITMGMIDFLTIQTSVNSKSGTALGVLGAIYSGLMTLIIYYYSNASDFSRQTGRYIDNCINRTTPLVGNYAELPSKASCVASGLKILLTTIPIFTTIFTSYTHFNQVSAIGDKIHKGDFLSKSVFNYINVLMIIFSIYSKFFFQVSFLPSIYNLIDEKFKHSPASLLNASILASSSTLFFRGNYKPIENVMHDNSLNGISSLSIEQS